MIAVVIGNTRYSFYSSCYITGINCWMGVTAFFFFFFFFSSSMLIGMGFFCISLPRVIPI